MNILKFCMSILLGLFEFFSYGSGEIFSGSKQSIRNSPYSLDSLSSHSSLESLLQTYPCSDLLGCMELSSSENLYDSEEESKIQKILYDIIHSQNSCRIYNNELYNLEKLQSINPHLWTFYVDRYSHYNDHGYSLLMYAVIRSNFVMIDFLKKSEVNPNHVDKYENRTALHKVVDQSDEQLRVKPSYRGLISWFMSSTLDHLSEFKNINPHIQDYKGQTALHIAVQNNLNFDVIEQLVVQFKIDCSLKNRYGQTARDIAQQDNQVIIVELLDKHVRQNITTQDSKKEVVVEKRARSLSENDAVLVSCNYQNLKLNSQLTHVSNKLSSSALTQSLMLKKSAEKDKDKHGKNPGIDKHATGSK